MSCAPPARSGVLIDEGPSHFGKDFPPEVASLRLLQGDAVGYLREYEKYGCKMGC